MGLNKQFSPSIGGDWGQMRIEVATLVSWASANE